MLRVVRAEPDTAAMSHANVVSVAVRLGFEWVMRCIRAAAREAALATFDRGLARRATGLSLGPPVELLR